MSKSPMGPWAPLPMCPIAHVSHYPCGPYPVAHTSCTPHPCTHCGLLPMCPIPPVAHTPCGLYWPHVPYLCTSLPCTPLPLWVSLPMCPIPLYPIVPCIPIAHRPQCQCDPYPLYPIALITHVPHCPMGTGVMRHMGNGDTGGNSIKGVWGTGV